MAHIRGLRGILWLLVGVLFGGLLTFSFAHAQATATLPNTTPPTWVANWGDVGYCGTTADWGCGCTGRVGTGTSADAATAGVIAYSNSCSTLHSWSMTGACVVNGLAAECPNDATVLKGGAIGYVYHGFGPALATCPEGSTYDDTDKLCHFPPCPAGETWNAEAKVCQPDCLPKAGVSFNGAVMLNTLQPMYCWQGCQANLIAGTKGGALCMGPSGATGVGLAWACDSGTFQYTGNQCGQTNPLPTPTQVSGPQQTVTTCPTGTCPGEVQGVMSCQPCGSPTPSGTPSTRSDLRTSTTTNADGSKTITTTTTDVTGEGPGVTTTTSTTYNSDGTVRGTSSSSGASSGENSGENPLTDFCKLNPNSPLCKSSSFGGSCGSFACEGDAVQCAMAREQHKRNCEMFDTDTPESTLGKLIAADNDPLKAQFPNAAGNVANQDLTNAINTSNPIGGGCIQDRSFQVMSATVTLPFSNLCTVINMLGQIVVAFSLVAAARIIYSGV